MVGYSTIEGGNMLNKLRLIWLIIVGEIIGESNYPSEVGHIREILVGRKVPGDYINARCTCPLCGQAHDPESVYRGVGSAVSYSAAALRTRD